MPLSSGVRLGPYEVAALLGSGGMGEVYRARDTRLDRDVAIKVLPATFASDAGRVARFEREAKAIAALSHPNILAIFDTGAHDQQMYVVTELLDGESLRARLESGALPVRKAIEIAIQIARGLAAAHEKGIVHRDLKPENVFLTKDGQVKILDFGLARQAATNTGASETAAALTDPGMVMGTVGYMSPEQVRGLAVDARSDLFSLGAVLYEMLAGRRAFRGETAADTMFAIVREEPKDLSAIRSDLPAALDRIVRHCLEKNPAERFQTARDVAFAVEALSGSGTATSLSGLQPVSSPRRVPVVVLAGVGAIVLAAGAYLAGRQSGLSPQSSPPIIGEWVRKTFDPEAVFNARFMPDGKTIVFSMSLEGRGADLYVLRPDALSPELLSRGSHLMSISSSGRLLVQTDASQIVMDRAAGKAARMDDLYSAPRPLGDNIRAADWGPGDTMALVREVSGGDQLEYPEGKVLYSTSGYVSHVRVSPDGNRIAFLDHDVRFDDRGVVKSVDRSGNVTTLAAGANGGDFTGQTGLAWSRDGSTVLFTAAVFAEEAPIRAVSVSAPGTYEVVAQSAGNLAIYDVAADGSLLVDRVNYRNGIMALTPGHQEERDLTVNGNTWFGFLSPRNGKQFLFTEWGSVGTDYGVALRNADETRTQHLGPGNAVGMSPDGKWALAYLSTTKEVRAYDIGSDRHVTLKTAFASLTATGLSWYPDSLTTLVCGSEKDQPSRCYRVAMDGTPARPVTPGGVVEGLVISGDRVIGRRADGTFAVFTGADGAPQPAKGLTEKDVLIGWSPSDRRVFAGRPAIPFLLDKVDIQSGHRQLFKSLAPPNRGGVMAVENPITLVDDGKYYSYHYTQVLSTLFVVQRTLPHVRH